MDRPKCACFREGYPDVGDRTLDSLGNQMGVSFEEALDFHNVCPRAWEWAATHAVLGVLTELMASQSSVADEDVSRLTIVDINARVQALADRLPDAIRRKLLQNEKTGKNIQ